MQMEIIYLAANSSSVNEMKEILFLYFQDRFIWSLTYGDGFLKADDHMLKILLDLWETQVCKVKFLMASFLVYCKKD